MTQPPLNVSAGANTPAGAVAPEPNGNGHSPNSVLSFLKDKAVAQTAEHIEEFPVGGEFGDSLRIRYKFLNEDSADQFVTQRANMQRVKATSLTMTMMARACIGLVGYQADGQSWQLADELGPVRLEHRLAVLLGFPLIPTTPEHPEQTEYNAHEVIMLLFGKNAMAVLSHGDDLAEWMSDPSKKPDVGKSQVATGSMSSPSAPSAESTPLT